MNTNKESMRAKNCFVLFRMPDNSFDLYNYNSLGDTWTLVKKYNKDECIFVMSLAKSIIESGKIDVNKAEVDNLIKDLKFLFKVNFGN